MIFLDFSKAFDSVNHNLLINRLQKLGFSGNLLLWITDYLKDRSQRVVLDGSTSEWVPVTSGVPQGSILGPLLFLLFINDMPDCTEHSILSLFADDAKCSRIINNIEDCEQLQRDLNNLYEWSQDWKLNFNVLKCKVLSFTRNVTPIVFKYHLNGNLLENISCYDDLGVTVDKGLVFNNHVSNVVNKCSRVNGMIRRSLGYRAPTSVSIKLYKALIQPIIEYSAPVWFPFTKIQIESIERIQRIFTRYALHYPTIDYKERCELLHILPLSFRREMMDIKLIFKSLFVSDFSNSVASLLRYYEPDRRLRSRQNGSLFYPRQVRTKSFKHFYSNRVVSIWNSLPKDLRQEQTMTSFVRQLNSFYYLKFEASFNCDNVCTWTSNCGCQACV